MKQAIAVFKGKSWVEYQLLFDMLRLFDVKIVGQDTYGDKVHEVKDDYLLIEDGVARWGNLDDFKEFTGTEAGLILGVRDRKSVV